MVRTVFFLIFEVFNRSILVDFKEKMIKKTNKLENENTSNFQKVYLWC